MMIMVNYLQTAGYTWVKFPTATTVPFSAFAVMPYKFSITMQCPFTSCLNALLCQQVLLLGM